MMPIEKFSLRGKIKFLILVNVWLLISSHTNLTAQNYHGESLSKYPYLWNILELYCYYNLSGPKDINELVKFINLSEYTHSGSYCYKTIRVVTIPKLVNNKDKLRIISTDCEYALILNDTLIFNYDRFPCCDFVEDYYLEDQPSIIRKKIERDLFLFKDKEPVFESEKLITPLIKELKAIYKEYPTNKEKIIFLKYHNNGYLVDYCNSNIDLSNPYYKRIEALLRDFCKEHDIDEIYLHIYILR